jgi:hypothetical protein
MLVQCRAQSRAAVNTAVDFWVPQKTENFWRPERLSVSQGIHLTELGTVSGLFVVNVGNIHLHSTNDGRNMKENMYRYSPMYEIVAFSRLVGKFEIVVTLLVSLPLLSIEKYAGS